MIIHSIISMEDIFHQEHQPEIINKKIGCGMLELVKSNNEYQIRRLFSTNPKEYLNKNYQPYNKLK